MTSKEFDIFFEKLLEMLKSGDTSGAIEYIEKLRKRRTPKNSLMSANSTK